MKFEFELVDVECMFVVVCVEVECYGWVVLIVVVDDGGYLFVFVWLNGVLLVSSIFV